MASPARSKRASAHSTCSVHDAESESMVITGAGAGAAAGRGCECGADARVGDAAGQRGQRQRGDRRDDVARTGGE